MERILPGSAMYDSVEGIRTLFNHGYDPQIGGKSLGVPRAAGERDGYAFTEVPLLDTSYVRDLLPGLRAGAYGSSFMFEVKEESWDWDPESSESNPGGLPERSIRGYQLFEDGPVTWPANPASDVQMNSAQQSGTDWYYTQLERSGLLKNGEEIRSRLRSIDRSEGRHPLTAGKRLKVLRELELRG